MGGHEQRRQEHTVCEDRICVRECKKGRNAVESLEPERLFSAMPPLEALELLRSLKVSMKTSRRGNPLKLAHFMPKARGELYVELPDVDPMKQKGFVGLLLRSMYGTQDALNLWQEDYTWDIDPARLHAWPVQPCSVSLSS